ncbi:MAG: GGDEF domain-containing protein [Lachnospiraceae bacterium]|nr:GGDEF domain-containing protein [Lachnospiraceae bacterium]
MSFDEMLSMFDSACCVMSIEKKADGQVGECRIITSNDKYVISMGLDKKPDNILYHTIVPKDDVFEAHCFDCAHKGLRLHYYQQIKTMNMWIEVVMLPLQGQSRKSGGIVVKYMMFDYRFTETVSAEMLADVSRENGAAIVRSCVYLQEKGSFEEQTQKVVEDIRQTIGAASVGLIQLDHEHKQALLLAEASEEEGQKKLSHRIRVLPYKVFADWSISVVNDSIVLTSESDFHKLSLNNPAWTHAMMEDGVKTLCVAPLYDDEKGILGYLYAVNFPVENADSIRELMVLESYFLRMGVLKNDLIIRLQRLSNYDVLTGAYNRNALKQRLKETEDQEQEISVVYADLNGLKIANDTYGHEAGDRLIVEAVRLLKDIFGEYEVYRAGGDEFVVIVTAPKKEFDDLLSALERLLTERDDISFSIGYSTKDADEKLERVIERADAMMYERKRQYHSEHHTMRA